MNFRGTIIGALALGIVVTGLVYRRISLVIDVSPNTGLMISITWMPLTPIEAVPKTPPRLGWKI